MNKLEEKYILKQPTLHWADDKGNQYSLTIPDAELVKCLWSDGTTGFWYLEGGTTNDVKVTEPGWDQQ